MNSEKIPLRTHVSAETMRLNPHLFTVTNLGRREEIPEKASKPKLAHRKLEQKVREPNKTEARFGAVLEARKKRGEIDSYRYEGMSLRWGGGMRYTADWVVIDNWTLTSNPRVTLIEVKGKLLRNQDLVRFKGCKSEWPEFYFEMWQEIDREWKRIL